MTKFIEFFNDFEEFNFEISHRGGIDFEIVNKKINEIKVQPFIIDISINGYSSKNTFDFEINKIKWKSFDKNFIKGEDAQRDPQALTIKRAIRLVSKATSKYIQKTNVETPLQKYNSKVNKTLCHLGGHYVCDEKEGEQLLILWQNFDKARKTKISESISRILSIRFGKIF
jgi:hypothetical protein